MLIRAIYRIYKSSFSGLPLAIWMLSLVVFVNRSGSMVLFFLSLYFTRELQLPVAMAGKLISIYGIGSLFGSFLGGELSDKFGAVRIQLLSLVTTAIGFILLSAMHTIFHIAVILFFLAIFSESFRPANATAIAENCPPLLRPRAFALNRLAINLGVSIGPAVGGLMASRDYQYLFWIDGLTCLAAAMLLIFYFRKFPVFSATHNSIKQVQKKNRIREDRIFLRILLLVFACGLIFVQLFNTWPIYLREIYGIEEKFIGLMLTLNALLVVIFEMPLVHKIQKYDHLKMIALGSLLLGLGFALLPLSTMTVFAAFTVMIWSVGEMLVFPLLTSYIANRADDAARGKYLGLYNLSFSLAMFIGPAAGAGLYDQVSPTVLWIFCGITGIITFFGFHLIRHIRVKTITTDHY